MKEENKIDIRTRQLCDVCSQPIDGDAWVVLGSKKIIHYGGAKKDECYRRLNKKHGA